MFYWILIDGSGPKKKRSYSRKLRPEQAQEGLAFMSARSRHLMARLAARDTLRFKMDFRSWVRESLAYLKAETIPLSYEIAAEAHALAEPFHKDPADRIIVATARCYGFSVLTADTRILSYPHVSSISAA